MIVASSLDHETLKEYSLVVNVSDGGSPTYVTVVMVTVYVRPENDYTPLFEYSNYSTNISEWTAIGKIYYNLLLPYKFINEKKWYNIADDFE